MNTNPLEKIAVQTRASVRVKIVLPVSHTVSRTDDPYPRYGRETSIW
jgi:hypothetical protein